MSIKFSTTVNSILGEVLRNAHAECIPSFRSPVVFFSSRVRDSSEAINVFISSIVISIIQSKLLKIFGIAVRRERKCAEWLSIKLKKNGLQIIA